MGGAFRCAHEVHFFAFEPQFPLLENSVISVLPASQSCCEDEIPQRNVCAVSKLCVDGGHGAGDVGAEGLGAEGLDSRVTCIQIQGLPPRSRVLPILGSQSSSVEWG